MSFIRVLPEKCSPEQDGAFALLSSLAESLAPGMLVFTRVFVF